MKEFYSLPAHMKTIQSIYIYLQMKEENNLDKRFNFSIPHTLILKDNSISSWIFSDKDDRVRKKKSLNITSEKIMSAFKRQRKQNRIDVVAFYIYPDWRNTEEIVTDYLNYKELEEIICKKKFRARCGVI